MRGELTVLVSPSCPGCQEALAIAADFAREWPQVRVRVVDVSQPEPDWSPPPGFAGTPMFFAGDTVLSYGNPTSRELRAAFDEAV